MVRAELLTEHTHQTVCGQRVHVWIRNKKYLARGRYQGRYFGQNLGADVRDAEAALRRLLVQLEDGTFQPPSEARKRMLKAGSVPRNSVRLLCDAFLRDTRSRKGKRTARDYQNRLTPLIEFAEQPDNSKRWPLAAMINREFAVEFRAFLHQCTVPRNGHPGAADRPMSPGQIFNVLDCVRTLFHWAKRPDVNQLPAAYVIPFTREVVGMRPKKDPLRPAVFPLERRIELVGLMDGWQLCQFAIALVLPLRPEDCTGLLVSEVDFTRRVLRFGTRMHGWDCNKGQQSFRAPFPEEIAPLLRVCAAGRTDGPLLRKRTVVESRRQPRIMVDSAEEILALFQQALAAAKPGEIQAAHDGKELFRRLLRDMGGVSPDTLAKEFKTLAAAVGAPPGARFYDLRGSVNTDMNRAGVSHLFQLYVTGHAVDTQILSRYVSLDLDQEMQTYFRHIKRLLESVQVRAVQLGLA